MRPAQEPGRNVFTRLGWFVAFWCAGVLALTAIGLTIRWALKM